MADKSPQQNAGRILKDTRQARVRRALGWTGLIFWLLISIAMFFKLFSEPTHENPADYYMPYVSLALAGLHAWMLLSSKRISRLIQDFRLYCGVLSREPEHSAAQISRILNQPLEKVMSDLQEMCKRGYFNGYLDHQSQCVVFNHQPAETNVVYCPGCGARNAISRAGDRCRYCDSPLR